MTALYAPRDTKGPPWSLRLVALARDAVSPSIAGSRADLERLTALRIDAGLLLLILSARLIHLAQATVDVTIGSVAYTHALVARLAATGCVIESVLLSVALVRRGRLTLRLLIADTVFGLAGLGLLSVATASTVGRTGTIDWMLPYTVVTATALGLIATSGRTYDWWGAAAALVLAGGYVASVSLPRLVAGERTAQVIGNAGNYLVFYLAAVGVSMVLRRQLRGIAAANDAAKRAASQLADEAQWRVVAVDVFGPVLDLLDRAADLADDVPEAMRQEADRLIELIEATNPGVEIGEHP